MGIMKANVSSVYNFFATKHREQVRETLRSGQTQPSPDLVEKKVGQLWKQLSKLDQAQWETDWQTSQSEGSEEYGAFQTLSRR